MKRLALFTAFAAVAAAAVGQNNIAVFVDGRPVEFRRQGPVMDDDRVLVPLRGVLQAMGATVQWDPATQTVTAEKKGASVRLAIGGATASVNGQPVDLDVPAQLINGSTMIPLRFVSEELGDEVKWDTRTQTVFIHENYSVPQAPSPAPEPPEPPQPPPPPPTPPPAELEWRTLPRGLVITVHSELVLNSDVSERGEEVSAIVDEPVPGIPEGSVIGGTIVGVRPHGPHRPGILDIEFDKVTTPDHHEYHIWGSLMSLLPQNVTPKDDLTVARPEFIDDRYVFAGLGQGPGKFIRLDDRRRVHPADGGPEFREDPQQAFCPAMLKPEMNFGIRLNRELDVEAVAGD